MLYCLDKRPHLRVTGLFCLRNVLAVSCGTLLPCLSPLQSGRIPLGSKPAGCFRAAMEHTGCGVRGRAHQANTSTVYHGKACCDIGCDSVKPTWQQFPMVLIVAVAFSLGSFLFRCNAGDTIHLKTNGSGGHFVQGQDRKPAKSLTSKSS